MFGHICAAMIVVSFAGNAANATGDNPYADVRSPVELKFQATESPESILTKKHFSAIHRELRVRHNYWKQDIGDISSLLDSIERLDDVRRRVYPKGDFIRFTEEKLRFAEVLERECSDESFGSRSAALRDINEAAIRAYRLSVELQLVALKAETAVSQNGD